MSELSDLYHDTLTLPEFTRIAKIVKEQVGINLSDKKKVMVETRLRRRLKELQFDSYKSYCAFLFSPSGMQSEVHMLIDILTTNKTDFFREIHHFEFLTQTAIPEILKMHGNSTRVEIWSSACSTGAEPYSIAMTMEEISENTPQWIGSYSILATDISDTVLEISRKGIYPFEDILTVPTLYHNKYLLRSKDREKNQVRIKPYIRSLITFKKLNLIGTFSDIAIKDIIFCRNVLIYFEKETQKDVVRRLLNRLRPGGFLFMGHSETLHAKEFGLRSCGPSVYQKM